MTQPHAFAIDGRPVGGTARCFVIAEAGVNHNGRLDLARELVRRAADAGADCVKFQTFRAEEVATARAPKAAYQLETTDPAESQLDMLRALELADQDFAALRELARSLGVAFLSTPYSTGDADRLQSIGVTGFKIASGQIVETHFLEHVARMGLPMIVSTGMATLDEIRRAEGILARMNVPRAYLQCTTNYPSRIEDANIRAMQTMGAVLGATVGYSDHTETTSACLAAVALGARVIEKHFTLDRTMPGPDHASSVEPAELAGLVRAIREVEAALGSGVKEPCPAELRNRDGMRRSLVARRTLRRGETITLEHLAAKRPATGFPPERWAELVGRRLCRDVAADESFRDGDVE